MLLAGLSKFYFWLSYFCAHFVLLMCSLMMSYAIMYAFNMNGVTGNNFFGYLLTYIGFAFQNIMFAYLLHYPWESAEDCQMGLPEPLNLLLIVSIGF